MAGDTAPGTIVHLRGVEKRYRRGTFRLGPIDVRVDPGITCVVGANGAGKSTLFRLICGLEKQDEGSIERGESGAQPVVGYMPQDPRQPQRASCVNYLHHMAWLYGVPRRERADRVTSVLSAVDLAERCDSRISSLSGGMARRLALATALIHSPDLLLLDEPTVGLDPLQRITMREILTARAASAAVMISTHLVEDVRAFDAQVVVLDEGTVVFQGTAVELADRDPGWGPGEPGLERAIAHLMGGRAPVQS